MDVDLPHLFLGVLGGLAVFFFGVHEMTGGMRSAAGDRLQSILERFTKRRVSSVASGAVTTAVVGSSSIVTIMTVGLVSSGLLAFENSLGVVMGANIGTTVSSQVIALGLTEYSAVLLVVGAILRFLVRRGNAEAWGKATMGIGFVFLGLQQIEITMAPVRDWPPFIDAIAQMENPFFGILIGAAITAVIQSSSATMGVVIILAAQGAVTLPAGVAIMMGAELGTCVDTLLSTIGQTRGAVRTGVFQLFFNLFNVALLVGFTTQLAEVAQWMTPGYDASAVARQIANAHVMFNCMGVLVGLPFVPAAARVMTRLIPDRPSPTRSVVAAE
ncbi:MAG: Na/Pi symporter [Myxococcota bacterium]